MHRWSLNTHFLKNSQHDRYHTISNPTVAAGKAAHCAVHTLPAARVGVRSFLYGGERTQRIATDLRERLYCHGDDARCSGRGHRPVGRFCAGLLRGLVCRTAHPWIIVSGLRPLCRVHADGCAADGIAGGAGLWFFQRMDGDPFSGTAFRGDPGHADHCPWFDDAVHRGSSDQSARNWFCTAWIGELDRNSGSGMDRHGCGTGGACDDADDPHGSLYIRHWRQ